MQHLESLWREMHNLIDVGGPVLFALVFLAFFIAYVLLILWHAIEHPTAEILSTREWITLFNKPDHSPSLIERIDRWLVVETALRSRQLQSVGQSLFGDPDRRFPFAFVISSVPPLVGLLGTVAGLFTTFQGLSANTVSHEAPIETMSRGISEALISTETGLVIGVPTLVICSWMKGRHDQRKLAFSKIESRLLQLSQSRVQV